MSEYQTLKPQTTWKRFNQCETEHIHESLSNILPTTLFETQLQFMFE